MSSRRSAILALALCVVALAHAIPAFSQSYGLGDQVLAVGATDFRPIQLPAEYTTGFGDAYLYGPGGLREYFAPLHLPDGAEIFQVCVYANIPDNGSTVMAELIAEKLVPGGESPGLVGVAASSVTDNIAIGYGTVCTTPFSYVFHETADVDGDGTTEHVAYSVDAVVNGSAATGFGGVRVFWRREASASRVPPESPWA